MAVENFPVGSREVDSGRRDLEGRRKSHSSSTSSWHSFPGGAKSGNSAFELESGWADMISSQRLGGDSVEQVVASLPEKVLTVEDAEPQRLGKLSEGRQGEAPSHDDGRRLPASSENLSALPWREGDAEGGVIPNEGAGVARLEEAEVSWSSLEAGRRVGRGGEKSSNGERCFRDMLCVGFAVALCLNLGSFSAVREGFFAAEVACLPPGAETVLPDLGIWVGWKEAVFNADISVSFELKVWVVIIHTFNICDFFSENQRRPSNVALRDLSVAGAAMGYLTFAGHAVDVCINLLGIVLLQRARRKPLEERMSRNVKRVCWASLGVAVWLCGFALIGFFVAVKGPVGSAAIAFYSKKFHLSCEREVSVSIDYAYAMTTLGFLCQVFIGVVALPKPSMWCPSFCKAKHGPGESRGRAPRDGDNGEEKAEDGRGRARSQFRPLSGESHGSTGSNIGRRATEARRSNTSSERNRSSDASVEVKRRSWGRATRGSPPLGGLDPSMVRDAICDPV